MDNIRIREMVRRMRMVLFSSLVLLSACRDTGQSADASFTYDPSFGYKDLTDVRPAVGGPDVSVRITRTFGSAVGAGMLGRIGAVSVSKRFLYAYDASSCEIVVFDREIAEATQRRGQCGHGPGDLFNVRRIVATDSTIEVFGERRISLWDSTLREISAIEVERIVSLPMPSNTQALLSLGGERYLVHRSTLGRRKASKRHSGFLEPWHLAVVHAGGSAPRHRFAIDDDFTFERLKSNFERYSLACFSNVDANGRRRIHVLNPFQPLLTAFLLEPDGMSSSAMGLTLPFPASYSPSPVAGDPNQWEPARGFRSLACDEHSIIASWRTSDSTGRTTTADALLIADGLTHRLVVERDEEAFLLTGRFVAIDGTSIFISRNLEGDFPMIIEAELLRRGTR